MAKCKVTEVRVKTVKSIHLELTEWEASILVQLFICIGGPHSGPRGITHNIKRALEESGIYAAPIQYKGCVEFFNEKESENE